MPFHRVPTLTKDRMPINGGGLRTRQSTNTSSNSADDDQPLDADMSGTARPTCSRIIQFDEDGIIRCRGTIVNGASRLGIKQVAA